MLNIRSLKIEKISSKYQQQHWLRAAVFISKSRPFYIFDKKKTNENDMKHHFMCISVVTGSTKYDQFLIIVSLVIAINHCTCGCWFVRQWKRYPAIRVMSDRAASLFRVVMTLGLLFKPLVAAGRCQETPLEPLQCAGLVVRRQINSFPIISEHPVDDMRHSDMRATWSAMRNCLRNYGKLSTLEYHEQQTRVKDGRKNNNIISRNALAICKWHSK